MHARTRKITVRRVAVSVIAMFVAPLVAAAQLKLDANLQQNSPAKPQLHSQPRAQSRIAAVRQWLPAPTLTRTIAGPSSDELLNPSSLVATPNGQLVLFDFGAMELRAFAIDGRALWRTGRKGSGPGEFRNAMDVKVMPNGNISVLDMGNRRITTVSQAGRLIRTVPLKFSSSRFIPLADTTRFGVTTEDSGSFWSAVNTRGDVVARGVAPPAIGLQPSLAREMFTAGLGAGAVVTFRWSNTFAILDANGAITTLVDGIEAIPFPVIKSYPMKVGKFTGQVSRVDPRAIPGALSVTSNGQQIFILFAGATDNRGRIIDVYNSTTGAYIGSRLLAFAVSEIVALPESMFATLRSDPVPSIDIWKVPTISAETRSPVLPSNSRAKGRAK